MTTCRHIRNEAVTFQPLITELTLTTPLDYLPTTTKMPAPVLHNIPQTKHRPEQAQQQPPVLPPNGPNSMPVSPAHTLRNVTLHNAVEQFK